ncbi:glutamate ABC transporter substrate-binding protein [Terrabacter terrigena]|uniref:Glutamate ABC transporter substrate-binding protein n=1 Tax=Terrabacter terrigena TaxID=574718 RepID=A0ABW3MT82_9MICO
MSTQSSTRTGTRTWRRRFASLASVAGLAALAGCSGVTYAETPLPTTAAPKPTTAAPAPSAQTCSNATQSYDPLPSLPSRADVTDQKMRALLTKGFITVGVSADTYLFGARDPFTSRLEGFDIDIAHAVAKAIFGDPNKVQFRVITAAERLKLLQAKEVDMVARNMSMTCDRWDDIAFSAEYYRSGQKVLVGKNLPDAANLALTDLKGKKVCAPTGTTSLTKLEQVAQQTSGGPEVVTAPNHTGCLVLFQQGKADAITGDDTVLAGLAAQDPNTVVTKAKAITVEPYGLGFNKADTYLARYVNRVIADLEADGEWKAIYNRWLAAPLGPAPAPPAPVYGR